MKLLSWNVNGLRAVVKKDFCSLMAAEKPDILSLQETKCQEDQVPADLGTHPWLKDMKSYWVSSQRKGYAGVATLSREEPLSVSEGLGHEEFDLEGRVQTLEYPDFYLVNTYFPNSQHELVRLPYKLEFNRTLLKHLNQLKKKKNVVLCGDLNVAHEEIDITHPKANEKNPGFYIDERNWFSELVNEKNGYVDTFRHFHPGEKGHYSWWSYRMNARARNIGWRLDYWVVNRELMPRVDRTGILNQVMGSDHCPVELVLKT